MQFTKHLRWTPQALAGKDVKINIYREEQLPTHYENTMSCMLEQHRGHSAYFTCKKKKKRMLICLS